MKGRAFLWLLLVALVTMAVTAEEEPEPPNVPLPIFTSIQVETSSQMRGAKITARYQAPEEPYTLWFVNGLPIQGGRVGYFEMKAYSNKTRQGITKMSTMMDKQSQFTVCLHNTVGEICLFLAAPFQDNAAVTQDLNFTWPLMTPGPLARYREGKRLKIHAPVMNTPYNYTYSASLYSKNPDHAGGRLVQAQSHGMQGGGDIVSITPAPNGKGWMLEVATDNKEYEGVLLINTTYVTGHGLVQACTMFRPFSVYRMDHQNGPFQSGFVAPIANPITWRCRLGVECMVVCPFLSNGNVRVTISPTAINSVLGDERLPDQPEEWEASVRTLGPYMGYGYVFIPSFDPKEDAGFYQCTYTTSSISVAGMVEVL